MTVDPLQRALRAKDQKSSDTMHVRLSPADATCRGSGKDDKTEEPNLLDSAFDSIKGWTNPVNMSLNSDSSARPLSCVRPSFPPRDEWLKNQNLP